LVDGKEETEAGPMVPEDIVYVSNVAQKYNMTEA